MRRFAYGRLPAVHTLKGMRSALMMAASLDPLGVPPSACNDYLSAVKVPWGMYRNDTLGDCVAADTAHTLMLRTANASKIVVPTDQDVISLYSAVGGYVPGDESTDNGCDETAMCEHLETSGFLGHRSNATGSIDPANLSHVRWCIQLFGACRIGLNLPAYAEDQFTGKRPWDVSGTGDQAEEGHDVPLVDYRDGLFTCITWGQPQTITPAFLAEYCAEAHCELYGDWVRAQGTAPPGFDLNDLEVKMKGLLS